MNCQFTRMTMEQFCREEFTKRGVSEESIQYAMNQMRIHCPSEGELSEDEIRHYRQMIDLFAQIRKLPNGNAIMDGFRKQVYRFIGERNVGN